MVLKSGINREIIESLFSGKKVGLRSLFTPMYVYADEPGEGEGDSNKNTPPPVNYEDLIAKARKEEKDKLYPKISALEKERDSYITKCNEYLVTVGNKDAEIAELNKRLKESGKDDTEAVKTLKAEIEKLTKELEEARKNVPDVKAIEEKIKAEYEVKLYRETKLREAGDEIILELVTGTTKEEVDASLEASKKRYKEMQEKILGKGNHNIPPATPNTSKMDNKKFSLEELAKLDPKSPEYKEFRKQMGFK